MSTTAVGQVTIIDTNGNPIVLKEMRHQSGPDWRDYARTLLDYDALGHNTSLRYSTRDFEGVWTEIYYIDYEYDGAGRMVAYEMRYSRELVQEGQDARYSYVYDDHGRLLLSRHFIPDGEGWTIRGRAHYTYDPEGRELRQVWQDARPDESWHTWKEVEFIYDDLAGTTTEVLKHADESEAMIIVSRTVTTRDGNELTALRQAYREEEQWENLTLRTSTLDDSGEEIAWTNAFWLNGEWSFNYRFRTLPDETPGVSVTMNETFNGTDWMPTLRTTTTIGQYGVPEIVAEEEYEAGEWRNRIRTVYTYGPLTPVSAEPEGSIADRFRLLGNYPNPFNPSTAVRFETKQSGHVSIRVFDITGREVARIFDGQMPAGTHEAIFDAGHLPSGVYISRMTVDGHTSARAMMLIK